MMAHNMPGISYQASFQGHMISFNPHHNPRRCILSWRYILWQRRKLKPRTIKGLAQGHTANKWRSQDPNLGSLTSGFNHWCVHLFQGLSGRRLLLWFWRYTIEYRNGKFKRVQLLRQRKPDSNFWGILKLKGRRMHATGHQPSNGQHDENWWQ